MRDRSSPGLDLLPAILLAVGVLVTIAVLLVGERLAATGGCQCAARCALEQAAAFDPED